MQRGGPAGHPLLLSEYDPSRSAEVPKRLFEGFQGVLQTDGYEGYGAIGREPGIVHDVDALLPYWVQLRNDAVR